MRIKGQGHKNDNEEQGGGIGPARPTFNHIPKIRNQKRPIVEFESTLDEDADCVEFANPRDRQREGRQWQPNYRGEDDYKLKVDIANFNGDLYIKGFFFIGWLTQRYSLNIPSFSRTKMLNLLLIS